MNFKHLLFITLYSSSLPGVNAQWTQLDDIPMAPFDGGYAFTIGDHIYAGHGSELRAYDPLAGTWETKADFPGTAASDRTWCVAFSIGSAAYVGMGYSDQIFHNDLWKYDADTDTWSEETVFPAAPRGGCGTFVIDGIGYICGGTSTAGTFPDVYSYDPASSFWDLVSELPTGTRGFPAAWSIGNYGYVYGGYFGFGNETNEVHRFDPVTNSWTAMANFPGGGRQSALAFVIADKAIVGMGHSGFTTGYSDFHSFDPTTNSWTSAGTFAGGHRLSPIGAVINEVAYMGSGSHLSTFTANQDWYQNSSLVGLDEASISDFGMQVIPSITEGPIRVVFDQSAKGSIEVIDLLGKVHQTETINGEQAELDINGLRSGTYVVSFSGMNVKWFQRVIKH